MRPLLRDPRAHIAIAIVLTLGVAGAIFKLQLTTAETIAISLGVGAAVYFALRWLFRSPIAIPPFASDEVGILLDLPYGAPALEGTIRRIAADTPLARFLKTRIVREPLNWPENARDQRQRARELRDATKAQCLIRLDARGESSFVVLGGPPLTSKSEPFVFYAEIYDWPLSSGGPEHVARFTVAYALYLKEFYKEAIEAAPSKTTEGLYLSGSAVLRGGNPAYAVDDFIAVTTQWDRRLYPDLWARAARNLGIACLRTGELPRAITAFSAALEMRSRVAYPSGWAYTSNNLAVAYYAQGHRERALQLLAEARDALLESNHPDHAEIVAKNIAAFTAAAPAEPSTLPAEVDRARRQIRELIGLPDGPFVRPGLRIAHRLVHASSVSGDFYHIIPRHDGSVGITLVDVEGHGLAASATAVAIDKALSRPGADWGLGGAREQLLAADSFVDEELGHLGLAVCMNFLEVDPYAHRARYAGAGMPFPLLFRYRQPQPETLTAVGMYVGSGYRRTHVSPAETEAALAEGDLILVFTDGIPEARDPRGRVFGHNGIVAAVLAAGFDSPEAVADSVLDSARLHTGRDQPDDDQAILVIQVGSPPASAPLAGVAAFSEIRVAPPARAFELLNSEDLPVAVFGPFKQAFFEWAALQLDDETRRFEAWSAIVEAVQNACRFGSDPGDVIRIDLMPASPGIEVVVSQPKRWPDWDLALGARRTDRTLRETHVGTLIMLLMATSVWAADYGRRVHMRFAPRLP
jgi:serine phosphatase RsbU (regulator of sigma subunit)